MEYNANGQFGFLDPKHEYGVLNNVVAYLLAKRAMITGTKMRFRVRRAPIDSTLT